MNSELLQYIPPSLIMIVGSLLLPLTKKYLRLFVSLTVPALTIFQVWDVAHIVDPEILKINFAHFTLLPLHVHPYTLIFATAFCIAAFAGALFGVMQARCSELVAGFIYAGCAIGICFSGDFITLFIYWELMAIASCIIIFSSKEPFAGKAAVRYAIIHFFSGVLLLAGIIAQLILSGSSEITSLTADMAVILPGYALDMNGIIIWLIMIAFLIGAAAPPLSSWLPDSYPKASPSGAVLLSAFTTKTAVFVLITLFSGTKILIFIGLFMVFYGIIYALLENDMRRILAYSIISQVGFMVVGVGIGTELALNGVALHAFCHIIYKALLFMSAGSVMYMTGKTRMSDLGGLWHSMRLVMVCAAIGLFAMSALPLTIGFISKPSIIAATADEGEVYIWLLILAASAATMLVAIKFLWFIFFNKDSGMRPKAPPLNMSVAMVLMAALCIIPAIPGIAEQTLYKLLPSTIEYVAYTSQHVLAELQLLLFSALAFFIMLPIMGRTRTISLDFDWFYRSLARYIILVIFKMSQVPTQFARILLKKASRKMGSVMYATHGPGGVMARSWTIGTTLMWTILLLGVYLVIYYLAKK